MPLISKGSKYGNYEGAIVLPPKCGLYLDNPVACVDYSSLYPSSIISENLSHDSKVWTKEINLDGSQKCHPETGEPFIYGERDEDGNFIYDNLPGYKYVDVKYETFRLDYSTSKTPKRIKSGYKICRFAQFPDGKAIMPSILEELLAARKATKKQMAKESDPFMKNILDKRQLSIKVTANSLYGQCGAKTSTFYEMDVAASTTATGRKLLNYAREIIENVYENMEVDTKYGPMLTNAEYIYGDSIAKYVPVYIKDKEGKTHIMRIDEVGKIYGESNWKTCIENGKEEKEYIDLSEQDILTWSDKGWTPLQTIIRHKLAEHKRLVRVITRSGMVDVTDDQSLLRNSGMMVKPTECKLGTELMHHAMCERTTTAYQSLSGNFLMSPYDTEMFVHSANVLNTINADGRYFQFSYEPEFDNISVDISRDRFRFDNPDEIIHMQELSWYNNYVYDLTTENHHFAAGVGNMIVHNTDSVFFTFNLKDSQTGEPVVGQKALEVTIEMAKEAGHMATKYLKKPHDLEYEKTFLPFCLLSKKRYVGMLYEDDPNVCYRKSMGIVLKRRDNAPIVKDVYGGIIDILMKDKNINKARDYLDKMMVKLLNKQISEEKLIITKSLRAFYKNPMQIAHKVLADRIAERDPGNKPAAGDRIPYIYIINNKKNALQGEKIEIPDYIHEKKLKIDYMFYISNQIMKPVTQLFSLVLYDIPEFQRKKNAFMAKLKTLKCNLEPDKFVKKESDLKNKEIESLLFQKHLIKGNQLRQNLKGIDSFFTKRS